MQLLGRAAAGRGRPGDRLGVLSAEHEQQQMALGPDGTRGWCARDWTGPFVRCRSTCGLCGLAVSSLACYHLHCTRRLQDSSATALRQACSTVIFSHYVECPTPTHPRCVHEQLTAELGQPCMQKSHADCSYCSQSGAQQHHRPQQTLRTLPALVPQGSAFCYCCCCCCTCCL